MSHQPRPPHTWVVLAVFFAGSPLFAAEAKRWRSIGEPGDFVVALAQDPRGFVWIGTEDKGVWRYDPKAEVPNHIKQFTTKDGLGDDNAYAVAVDKLGRVWVGHLNHGVSVYNGEKWQNYNILDGPIGERIFAITTCPTDGDVWMATSGGLTRYSLKDDAWSYFCRAEGLPEDQANALAFDAEGGLYVGTQCYGIAVAKAADGYRKWSIVPGSEHPSTTPTGTGLPSGLINGLTITRDGTVYAATTSGLAWSKDKGKTWSYRRGRDYAAKVRDRWGGAPAGWREAPKEALDQLLPEDYVTCVTEDEAGTLWLGFRQNGYIAFDPKTNKRMFEGTNKSDGLPDDYVSAMLPGLNFKPVVASYGGGAATAMQAMKSPGGIGPNGAKTFAPDREAPPFPATARAPTMDQLRGMLKTIKDLPRSKKAIATLGEDWTTQGDWVGRYGRQIAMLCAMASPLNHDLGWDERFVVKGMIGPHCSRDDALRHWVHWEKTDNPNSLYEPVPGYRRQAEWDDHGEAYPMSHDGPGVWALVTVPDGLHRVSLYFFNKDGHDGMNRHRDFLVELKGWGGDLRQAETAPPLARCRVRHFWGGVYKRFVVPGPGKYLIKIGKNGSFNTICSGVFVDRLLGPPGKFDGSWLPFMDRVPYAPPELGEPSDDSDTLVAARDLWRALDEAYDQANAVAFEHVDRIQAYRAARIEKVGESVLSRWRWTLPLWTPDDRKEFEAAMAKAREERARIKQELEAAFGPPPKAEVTHTDLKKK